MAAEEKDTEIRTYYDEVDKKTPRSAYYGLVVYYPFDNKDAFFQWMRLDEDPDILSQISSHFDPREALSISKRCQTLEIKYQGYEEPVATKVFARLVKGYNMDVLKEKLAEWNSDLAHLSAEQREKHYKDLVLTHKEKFVPPFHIVRCSDVGAPWTYEKYITRVDATKKEMAAPYPQTTDQSESDMFNDDEEAETNPHDVAQVSQDLELSTSSSSKKESEKQKSPPHKAVQPPVQESPDPLMRTSLSSAAESTKDVSKEQGQADCTIAQFAGTGSTDEPQPGPSSLPATTDAQQAKDQSEAKKQTPKKDSKKASSKTSLSSSSSRESAKAFQELQLQSASEAAKLASEQALVESKICREATEQYVPLTEFEKIMCKGMIMFSNHLDAQHKEMNSIQLVTDAINNRVSKRERSVSTIKKKVGKMSESLDKLWNIQKGSAKGQPTSEGGGAPLTKLEAHEVVKVLLKIDIVNEHAETLLDSIEFQEYIKEKLERKMRGVSKASFAASFNRHFFNLFLSTRLIAYVYWGADSRATNIKWCGIPVTESVRELWDRCLDDLLPSGITHEEMITCRKGQWNEAKRARQDALRKTDYPKELAESNVYDDMVKVYNDHKALIRKVRGTKIVVPSKDHHITTETPKHTKQYAVDPDQVEKEPDILKSNAGQVCNADNVAKAIEALGNAGYGRRLTSQTRKRRHDDSRTRDTHGTPAKASKSGSSHKASSSRHEKDKAATHKSRKDKEKRESSKSRKDKDKDRKSSHHGSDKNRDSSRHGKDKDRSSSQHGKQKGRDKDKRKDKDSSDDLLFTSPHLLPRFQDEDKENNPFQNHEPIPFPISPVSEQSPLGVFLTSFGLPEDFMEYSEDAVQNFMASIANGASKRKQPETVTLTDEEDAVPPKKNKPNPKKKQPVTKQVEQIQQDGNDWDGNENQETSDNSSDSGSESDSDSDSESSSESSSDSDTNEH